MDNIKNIALVIISAVAIISDTMGSPLGKNIKYNSFIDILISFYHSNRKRNDIENTPEPEINETTPLVIPNDPITIPQINDSISRSLPLDIQYNNSYNKNNDALFKLMDINIRENNHEIKKINSYVDDLMDKMIYLEKEDFIKRIIILEKSIGMVSDIVNENIIHRINVLEDTLTNSH